jgi:serine/threonine-protein kinase
VILGTAAYMAPEQARGKAVDKRADVWAFGVVLFEMLTGRRAFEGSDVSDTLAFILTKDPDWAALPAETPAPIRRLLRRCLQKDPRQRLADMSDARLELDEAASPLDSERAARLITRSRWLVPAMAVGITAAALLGGLVAWSLLGSSAPPLPLASFSIPLPEGAEFTNAGRHVVTISQDGRRIVYVANRQLYLREIGSVGVKPIAGSETAGAVVGPAFSPDGQQVVYYSEGALRRIAVAGGTPMPVAAIASPLGVHWAADGIFVGLGAGGIGRIPVDGGKLTTIATVGPDESAQGPQLLPGGDVIIFTIATGALETRWDKARIVAHSLRTGERKVLIEGGSDARYVPTGHLLYAESGVVYAVPFDSATLAVGARAPVIEGVLRFSVTGAAQFAVSRNGTAVYVPGPVRPTEQRLIGYLDRSGNRVALPVPAGAYETPRVSPDGRLVAVGRSEEPDNDIWIYDLSNSSAIRRLTFGGNNRFPAWSPDGRQVVFQSDRDGDAGLYVQSSDISGAASRLTKAEPGSSHVANSWSSDGQSLLFTSVGSTTALHVLSLKDRTVKPLHPDDAVGSRSSGSVFSGLRSSGGAFSPDGQWLAYYAARTSGELDVLVEPFPATGEKYQITPAIHPAWSTDGRELFTSPNGPEFVVFRITTGPHFAFREAARIRRGGSVGTTPGGVRNYDVMPDGRLLVVMPIGDGPPESREIRVMLNWFEELKKR